jgi:hypothetical protein
MMGTVGLDPNTRISERPGVPRRVATTYSILRTIELITVLTELDGSNQPG